MTAISVMHTIDDIRVSPRELGEELGLVLKSFRDLRPFRHFQLDHVAAKVNTKWEQSAWRIKQGFGGLEVTFTGSSGQNSVTRPQPDHRGWGNFIFLWVPAKTHAVVNT